ncbi:MAG TPA: ABC transporter permease [Thermoanaerobaculia bacterium]|nr:ABC transporter permease [Thermoanaerobaculia bacterium]
MKRARTAAERLTAVLLHLAPQRFRDEAEAELLALARESAQNAHGTARVTLLLRIAADLLRAAAAEHAARRPRLSAPRFHLQPRSATRSFWRHRMDGLLRDLRDATRNLVRAPGLVTVVTLTLMLGIGLNTVIFSLVDQTLLRLLPVAEPERLVRVYTSDYDSGPLGSTSFPDFLDFRAQAATSLSDLAAFLGVTVQLDSGGPGGEVGHASAEVVTGNYFATLGLHPYSGRFFDATEPGREAPAEAVLSFAAFEQRFGGDLRIVGERVRVNGQAFTIVGIAQPRFRGLDAGLRPELWLPMSSFADAIPMLRGRDFLAQRGSRWLNLVGRLAETSSADRAQVELQTAMNRLAATFPDTNLGTAQEPDNPRPMTVLSAQDGRLGSALDATVSTSRLLFVLVGVVLLVACINVASVLFARGLDRSRELAVRLALGARRGAVVRQLLVEGVLLACVGGAAGLLFAWMVSRALAADLLPALAGGLAIDGLELDPRVLSFTVALSVATGLVCGLAPALRLRRSALLPDLRGDRASSGGSRRRAGLAEVLVVVQVAGACVLLVAAGLLGRSLARLVAVDLGFDREGVVLASMAPALQGYDPARGSELYRAVLEEVQAIPGVDAASLSSVVPVQSAGARRGFRIEGYQPAPTESTEINLNFVSPGYFRALRVPLLRGRPFVESDHAEAPPVAIVNAAFVERYLGGGEGVGRRIGGEELEIEIVGVASNGKYRNLREDTLPYVYIPLSQSYWPAVSLAVRSAAGDPLALVDQVRAAVARVDSDLPLTRVRLLHDHVGAAAAEERSLAILVSGFSVLTLALAAIGLYGVLATAVARRRRELGIRSALGASRAELLGMVFSRGFALTALGIVVGGLAAAGTARVLATRLFGVGTRDPATLGVTVLVLGSVAALACLVPARRATKVDPATVLRME